MDKKQHFLKQFLKDKKTIGAVSPSSRFLAKKMLDNIDFSKKVFVELGPGTGVFTRKIVERIAPDATLFVFELHVPFYEKLKEEFSQEKRVVLINDSAEKIKDYLKKHHFEYADAVLSSLPLANFNAELTDSILKNIYESLRQGGEYRQFQYSLRCKKQIRNQFDNIKITFTSRNLPPAFVYSCKKK